MRDFKLLLVEDDEDDYVITRDLIEDISAGRYQLDWARDLESARKLLSRNEHDLCLMDYMLGPIDGVSLLKEAQTIGFTRPIIMLTGQDDETLDQKALSAGAVDYLVKSQLTQSRLQRAIRYSIARRETELERLERLRAESESRAKTQFLTHLSHELRTPLTSILGYTDLLLNQQNTQPIDYLQVIKRNGQHLLSLLNDVLDLSKIETGKLEIEHVLVDFHQLLTDLYQLLIVRADDKNIGFEFHIAQPIPKQIKTDPTRLRQILVNLLSNAIKFTEQGQVTMAVSIHSQPPSIQFHVTDTGMGIEPAFMSKLFTPFERAASVSSEPGTGLGLAISQNLAQQLGGDIRVESTLNQGSEFCLTIHADIPDGCAFDPWHSEPTHHNPTQPKQPPLNKRILVADDVEELRVLLGQIISNLGAEPVFASNGQEAVDLILNQDTEIDLILMDMQMPLMDGLEATRLLRANGFKAPIIALTAATMKGERERCLQAGCSEHISKPIDQTRLQQSIYTQLEHTPGPEKTNHCVLLIEDDDDARNLTAILIESLGLNVVTAANGKDALECYRTHQPRWVLMDWFLPDCQGDELAQQFTQIHNHSTLVALTGHELTPEQKNECPFTHYLLKPINLDTLKKLLVEPK
ncbi:MAG: response regulator [Pseudomonadales bacterium]|nr:response regulator [Pseudomonadales bacterium]